MRTIVNVALALGAIFLFGVIGELVPPLRTLEAWMLVHRLALLLGTGATAALGLLLLIGSVVVLLMDEGTPMSPVEIEDQQRRLRDAANLPYAARASRYRLWGKATGFTGEDRFSLGELKHAVAKGMLLREPLWRRRACAIAGGMLMFLGLFGSVVVMAPLAVKLFVASVALYAAFRIAGAYVRA